MHLYFRVLLCTLLCTVVQYLYSKPRMSRNKSKSDIAGTAKKCQVITMETKVKIIERVEQKEEGVTEELKRFMMQEIARGFSLFQEALLVFEAQDPNVEQCMKIAVAVQSATVTEDEEKRATAQMSLDLFFSRR